MDMSTWLKRSTLMGLGLLSLTKKKAAELANDLSKNGSLSEKEGKKLAQELLRESRKHTALFERLVRRELGKALSAAGVATKNDLQKLKKEMRGRRK